MCLLKKSISQFPIIFEMATRVKRKSINLQLSPFFLCETGPLSVARQRELARR